jgi:DNA-binding beta-propeller fold protein YncE
VAEGADVPPLSHAVSDVSSSRCPPDVCVAAVLGDALRRVAVLGGREGMSRSLGSVYGGSVTRFLGGSLRGVVSRVIDTGCVASAGIAVSRDGCTLLLSSSADGSHAIREIRVADGCQTRAIGTADGPLQFYEPRQVCVAPDGFVYVADCWNHRVQVLTPTLDFHSFVGVDELGYPVGVCANADVVVVAEGEAVRISVFSRRDSALLRRFGSEGSDDGDLITAQGMCFMSGDRHVAVAEWGNSRVSVFSIDGEFIRHVGVGVLKRPRGIACSAFDELVVNDTGRGCVVVFSASGELLTTMGSGDFRSVAMHGSTVFAQGRFDGMCVVFE